MVNALSFQHFFRIFAVVMSTERIAYIDALRGTTMLLVVYSHLCGFCLGDWSVAGNGVLMLFRLPTFFFISGWLFGRQGPLWSIDAMRHTIGHKFMVQIVPTVIFLLLLAPPPSFFWQLGAMKGGYWFTFVLFEFFILSIVSDRLLGRLAPLGALLLSLAAFLYDAYYNTFFCRTTTLRYMLGFLSFSPWRFYIFFSIGVLVRRHFTVFIAFIDRFWVLPLAVVLFAMVAMMPVEGSVWLTWWRFLLCGVLGVLTVFTLFRRCSSVLGRQRWLTFLGRRTLDVYLLHYFLLPRFLTAYAEELTSMSPPMLALVLLLLSGVVTGLSLAVSWVLRLSPLLARYLFGVRSNTSKNCCA